MGHALGLRLRLSHLRSGIGQSLSLGLRVPVRLRLGLLGLQMRSGGRVWRGLP